MDSEHGKNIKKEEIKSVEKPMETGKKQENIVKKDEEIKSSHEEHRDYIGSKMGMWIFLFTEIILFGGLFLLYSVYRAKYAVDFHNGALELNTTLGALNTIILLTSSLCVALSITAIQKGDKKLSLYFLIFTILMAFAFLVIKYFEWSTKIHHGIYPNSPELSKHPKGQIIFFGLYYVMTGLHGIHIIIGIIVLSIMLYLVSRGIINKTDFIKLENAGLYWHIVDIIWIYLFPLFYLIT